VRRLRVGLDYRPALFGRGGIRVYAAELAAAYALAFPWDALELDARRWRRPDGPVVPPALLPSARLHRGRTPWRVQRALARVGLGADRMLGGLDVFHQTDYVDVPLSRAARVTTVHDVLFDELPDCYTPEMLEGLRHATATAVRTSARIVVPSERTRRGVVERYGAREERVEVVPHGVRGFPRDPEAAARAREEHGDYVLFVGTLEPRKNLARLLEAHALVRRAHRGLRLVVAGPRGWKDDALVASIAAAEGVLWEERADAARLGALYGGALAVAYPSLGEGFGLPVLEAMSCGRALVVGAGTACEDLAGDAALAVDPRDVEAIAGSLARLVEDGALRARLGARGIERAAEHTWDRAARATRECYLRAVGA
jgi:glycosyltransferase involved in cell wall biosynthesis